jgi:hypothetical protein
VRDAHGEALQLAAADGVDDADVGDRGDDEVVECGDGVLQAAGAVGDLGDGRQQGEALPVAARVRAPAREQDGQHDHGRDDPDAVDVCVRSEVVMPDPAQRDEPERDRADRDDVARAAAEHRQQRRQHDDADDGLVRLHAGVDDRQQRRDRQARGERERAPARRPSTTVGRRGHAAIIRSTTATNPGIRARIPRYGASPSSGGESPHRSLRDLAGRR